MEVANMKFQTIRIVRGIAAASAAGMLFLSLTACNSDMLTYAQDAKRAGMQQYNDGKYADATGSFKNAARQDPRDAETEYWLALSFEQTGDYHQAINSYKTCLGLMPHPNTATYNPALHDNAFERLARVVAATDTSGTETDLIVKTASDNKSAVDYQLLGRIFRYRSDADTAMEDYRQGTHLDPNNFAIAKELGIYLESLGQNQEASSVLRDAYRLNQNDKDLNGALERIGMSPGIDLLAQSRAQQGSHPAPQNNLLPDPTLAIPAANRDGPSDGTLPKD
jgi:tetratricopeptide (TPR) repeat protein